MDAEGKPAWPEMFPSEKIKEIQDSVGPRHFSAQMMLEYVAQERVCLDPGAVNFYEDDFDFHTSKISDHLITGVDMYWDPSSGRQKCDGSVCVLIYRDDKNRDIFVHDILYMVVSDDDLYPLANQCENVIDFMVKHNLNRIGIETNGIGNALPEIMRNIALKRQFPINIIKISNHIKKETRILNALEPVLSTGHLYMHSRIKQTVLLAEMLSWTPIGSKEHDDGLDAVAGAISMIANPIRPISNKINLVQAKTDFQV